MLKCLKWSKETNIQTDQPSITNFNKRDDTYWRDISFRLQRAIVIIL